MSSLIQFLKDSSCRDQSGIFIHQQRAQTDSKVPRDWFSVGVPELLFFLSLLLAVFLIGFQRGAATRMASDRKHGLVDLVGSFFSRVLPDCCCVWLVFFYRVSRNIPFPPVSGASQPPDDTASRWKSDATRRFSIIEDDKMQSNDRWRSPPTRARNMRRINRVQNQRDEGTKTEYLI